MRLIDADAIKCDGDCQHCQFFKGYDIDGGCEILEMPTAYDVDKVVEELDSSEYPFYLYTADGCDVDESLLKADMVESIVRRGGVDDSASM